MSDEIHADTTVTPLWHVSWGDPSLPLRVAQDDLPAVLRSILQTYPTARVVIEPYTPKHVVYRSPGYPADGEAA